MQIVALGEEVSVQGFGLAGAVVLVAEDPGAVRAAWAGLADDVAVVILTPAAARALGEMPTGGVPFTVVIPP